MQSKFFTIESLNDILQFDKQTLRLVSFRSKSVPEQEFIHFSQEYPVFVIGYLNSKRQYRFLHSYQAENIKVEHNVSDCLHTLKAVYSKISGNDIQVICTVTASREDRFVRWSISFANYSGLEVVDVQYPFIVCASDLKGTFGSEAILLPHGYGSGRLIKNPGEITECGSVWQHVLERDNWKEWEFTSRVEFKFSSPKGDCNHYPGMQFAQFLAYYNNRAGLYLACEDTHANIKRFAALHREPGIRLGIAHVGDWPTNGQRILEYDTVMCGFTGDWYDAADIYRNWSFKQKWFVSLHKRHDIPEWLIDSPVYITLRPQGVLDTGIMYPIKEFLPYEKCIPLLEKVAEKVQASLSVILMGWEHGGSWVSPDSFPPIGGEESMKQFIKSIKDHGWRAGSFCSGTRWVVGHTWNNYDGRDYFDQHKGETGVCREADGSMWQENWDVNWRPSYACCLGSQLTRDIAAGVVKHLIGWGMESLQFLDQNNGSSTFPCFSREHEHPPIPGKWMAEKMKQLINEFHDVAYEVNKDQVVHSAEAGLNEYCLPLFQQTELRVYPPDYGVDNIPLYQYLFHECVIIQGMMGNAPEPYHLVIRNATNCVLGSIPGGVMTGDGTLLDKDTMNWANWNPKVENSKNAFEMIRTITALRRGPAKDFLIYGRMLRPANVSGIKKIEWTYNGRDNKIPAVFHSTWQSPDGRTGIVLANWTTECQEILINDNRLQKGNRNVSIHISGLEMESSVFQSSEDGILVVLPSLSCALLDI